METYFSIISTPLNTVLNEKIGVGLVMYNSEISRIKFSYNKLSNLKGLISGNKYTFIKLYLKNIEHNLNESSDLKLFNEKVNNYKWINNSYVNYLHRYTNNSLIFSEPQKITIELSDINFKKIFEKYIFEFDEDLPNEKNKNIVYEVRNKLYDKIENNVNLNVTVSPNDFTELIAPVDVNFIGKNDVIVAGQTIDFNKKHYFLENDLSRYVAFTKAADYMENEKGKYFVIGQEPAKDHFQHHNTWKNVKESNLVDYVDLSETERIMEYISTHRVKPLYDKIDNN